MATVWPAPPVEDGRAYAACRSGGPYPDGEPNGRIVPSRVVRTSDMQRAWPGGATAQTLRKGRAAWAGLAVDRTIGAIARTHAAARAARDTRRLTRGSPGSNSGRGQPHRSPARSL